MSEKREANETKDWRQLPADQLRELRAALSQKYDELKAKELRLDLSRGKPPPEVLDLSNELLDGLDSHIAKDGTDIRNYGVLDGLPE